MHGLLIVTKYESHVMRFLPTGYHQEMFEHGIRCRLNNQFVLQALISDPLLYALKKGNKLLRMSCDFYSHFMLQSLVSVCQH